MAFGTWASRTSRPMIIARRGGSSMGAEMLVETGQMRPFQAPEKQER